MPQQVVPQSYRIKLGSFSATVKKKQKKNKTYYAEATPYRDGGAKPHVHSFKVMFRHLPAAPVFAATRMFMSTIFVFSSACCRP